MSRRTTATYALAAALALLFAFPARAQWVEDSIDVGGRFVGDLAYNANADVVYGLSNTGDFVFAIACATNEVVSRVDASYPRGMAYNGTDAKLYCSYGVDRESVLVVSGVTHQRLGDMPLAGADLMVWDPVNDYVYVSRTEHSMVSVINCATDSVIDSISTDYGPLRMHLNPVHHKLYVQNYDGNSVSVVDLGTNEVITTIDMDGYPEAGCYCAAVDKYYCGAGASVVVLAGASDSVLRRIQLTDRILSIVSIETHGLAMAAGAGGNRYDSVYVLDTYADSLVRVLTIGGEPYALAWSPSTDLVYSANSATDDVSVLADDGTAVLRTLAVGNCPFVFQQVARHDRLYLGHSNSNMVYVIKDRAGGVEESASVEVRRASWVATVVGDVLRIEYGTQNTGYRAGLLNILGQRVMELQPGENDVRQLSPGIYFVLTPHPDSLPQGARGQTPVFPVRKVVVQP